MPQISYRQTERAYKNDLLQPRCFDRDINEKHSKQMVCESVPGLLVGVRCLVDSNALE